MNGEDKAKDLVSKMYGCVPEDFKKIIIRHPHEFFLAKDNALIAVDEILKNTLDLVLQSKQNKTYIFWQEVKKEIEKL